MSTQDQTAALSIEQMIAQRDAWEARVRAAIAEQKSGVIAEIKAKIAAFGLTAADLGLNVAPVVAHAAPQRTRSAGGERKGRAAPGTGKVPPKYGDNAGNYWTGRGKKPGWVAAIEAAGGNMESYRLSPEAAAAAHSAAQAAAPQVPPVTQEPANTSTSAAEGLPVVTNGDAEQAPVESAQAEQAPVETPAAVEVPKGAKYTDGKGNFWNGLFRKPEWVQAHLDAGNSLESLAINLNA